MEEKKEMNVSELIKMFTAISYFQETIVFKFSDIYNYIYNCYQHSSKEYQERIAFADLINEAEATIASLVNEGKLSYVYPDGLCGMYRVNSKNDFSELVKYPKEYIIDMNKVFLDIHGGEPKEYILTLSETKKNNR